MTQQTVLIEDNAADALVKARPLKRVTRQPDPPPHPQTVEWLALERRRRTLEEGLKSVVSQQEALRQKILERWSMDGTNKEVVDGYTVHLQRKLYPKLSNKPALAVALLERGLSELLTVDEKAFGIYLTACDENEVPLPDSIASLVPESFERHALVVKLK